MKETGLEQWYLPKNFILQKDKSRKYVVSENQLRKLFSMRFALLDFNRDYIREFIKKEKLSIVKNR